MIKKNLKLFLFIFLFGFSTTSFAEDYLKNIMTDLNIAVTNESKKNTPVDIEIFLDDKKLIEDMFFRHHDPITGTPNKNYHFTKAIGNHQLKVKARKGEHQFLFPISIGSKGLYIDLRYQDGRSPKKQTNYKDGRILIQEGHFQVVMAPPGVIGYD